VVMVVKRPFNSRFFIFKTCSNAFVISSVSMKVYLSKITEIPSILCANTHSPKSLSSVKIVNPVLFDNSIISKSMFSSARSDLDTINQGVLLNTVYL